MRDVIVARMFGGATHALFHRRVDVAFLFFEMSPAEGQHFAKFRERRFDVRVVLRVHTPDGDQAIAQASPYPLMD